MKILSKTDALLDENPTPLVRISDPLFDRFRVRVYLKRDELNHPVIQGNKWHKLKFNLQAAAQQGKTALLTFGGAYSNHIAATAYAGRYYGFETIGLIRGEELAGQPQRWSHTLQQAQARGMQLEFLSRSEYRRKSEPDFISALQTRHPHAFLLPEGGSNPLAIRGIASITRQLQQQKPDWTHLYTAVGTGGTLAGLVRHADPFPERVVKGVAALKGAEYLLPQIQQWIGPHPNTEWQLLTQFHDGGYGKCSTALKQFKADFENRFQIPLDPVYTVKMVAAFYHELAQGVIPPGAKVILLHTGGLQGEAD